jgi:biopolymer transport protein ExbB/TolQ
MSRSASHDPKARSSFASVAAFLFGLPVGSGLLLFLHRGPFHDSDLLRYVEHPVEMTEVVMFCCAVGALLAKLAGWWAERSASRSQLLPPWDGQPVPVATAAALREHLARQSARVQGTLLGRRVANVLEFAQSRGSANDLDDQIRTLADNDVMAQDSSYALLRFITWAIPILGFLGTVLGITSAIKGVTPEVLEKSLSGVTDGLATAFDSTALALFLTMILMLCTSLVERLEQGILEKVDAYVDAELTHRFERTDPESSQLVDALRQNTQVLLKATEQLVERQASLWSRSLEKADRVWNETGHKQQEKLTTGLTQAL